MAFEFKPQSHEPVVLHQGPNPGIGKMNILIFTSFALVIACFFGWGPLSSAFKRTWARQCARDALASLATEDFGHAISQLFAARDWAPQDPEVLRAIITYLKTVQGNPGDLEHHLRLLADKEPLTVDEQILYASTLLTSGHANQARRIYDNLPQQALSTPEGMSLLSKLRASEGQSAEAVQISRQVLQLEKNSPEARLAVAIQESKHTFPEYRDRSWAQLWELTKLKSQTGIDAVVALSKENRLKVQEAQNLLELVDKHPYTSLKAKLAIITALIRLQPQQRDTLIQQEVDHFQTVASGSLEDFAAWLAEHRQHAHLLKIIPSNLITGSQSLYTYVVKALVGQGRWKELKDMLNEKRPPVSNTLVKIWLADAESHLQPDLDESRRHLAFAIDSAIMSKEAEELELAGLFAYKLGMLDLALKSHLALANMLPAKRSDILHKAREIALQSKDTRVVLNTSQQLQALHPTNGIYADQLTYFRLLLGEEMEQVDLTALKHADKQDAATASANKFQRIPISLLEALAAFRFSDRDSLMKHIQGLPTTDGLPAGYRAVLAGLLATTGKPDRAFQIAEKVPASLLLDEEKSFLKLAQ